MQWSGWVSDNRLYIQPLNCVEWCREVECNQGEIWQRELAQSLFRGALLV